MGEFSHFDANGNAVMVDVSNKIPTNRTATAEGTIRVNREIMQALVTGSVKKGDVLGVARVAGIMGVKQTASLIPMCHTLLIQKCTVDFRIDEAAGTVTAICTVKSEGQTGVEMEALTGVNVTLLTIYDMCKAIDKGMVMENIHLISKSGGKSGDFHFCDTRQECQSADTMTGSGASRRNWNDGVDILGMGTDSRRRSDNRTKGNDPFPIDMIIGEEI